MARGIIAEGFTGATTADLDFTDGSVLVDGDIGKVRQGGATFEYILNASSGATADGFRVIAPALNAGSKRWELLRSYSPTENKGNYSKTGANEVTFEAVGCWAEDQGKWIECAAQAVTVPNSLNTVYNFFACDDGIIRTDTDEDGANLSAYTISFVGTIPTNSSGEVCGFVQSGDILTFVNASEVRVGTVSTTRAAVDISTILPTGRVSAVMLAAHNSFSTGNSTVRITADSGGSGNLGIVNARGYTNDNSEDAWGYGTYSTAPDLPYIPYNDSLYAGEDSHAGGTTYLLVRSVILKR